MSTLDRLREIERFRIALAVNPLRDRLERLERDFEAARAERERSFWVSVRAEAARLEAEDLCVELLRLYDTAAEPPDAWGKGGEKRAKVEAWRRRWATK